VVVREEFHQPRDRHRAADVGERVLREECSLQLQFGEVGGQGVHKIMLRTADGTISVRRRLQER
jgi:hypothetical protein